MKNNRPTKRTASESPKKLIKKKSVRSSGTEHKFEEKPYKDSARKSYSSKNNDNKKPAKVIKTKQSDAKDFSKPKRIIKKTIAPESKVELSSTTRLNKYIANAGICSRREADVFIKAGSVSVNGKTITEMGYQVQPGDVVRFGDESINQETKRYVLLNKPKDYITTTDDERDRKTVMDLVVNACKERIVPVGRLDRKTTGLLLLTNDGDLAKKLTHPKHRVNKLYHVTLDKNVAVKDIQKIIDPDFTIEELPVFVDSISYVEGAMRNEVGIGLHSGRNRIVRKIFESLGYQVVKLDRVMFAGLTKKDLPRGHWRHLTTQEIINLRNGK